MDKSLNGKPSQKKNSRTQRKRWKRRKRCKNRNTRAKQRTARFLENWYPLISNGLPKVPSAWWNVLTVEECVRSPQTRAFSGSNRTLDASSRLLSQRSVGRPQEKQ